MGDITRILAQIDDGEAAAAERLLPLVYDELRKLAAAKMAQERPEHTLQATALVHEAYIRLVDTERVQHWNSRGHFFAAAAAAMRRILVDHARRKLSGRRGGGFQRLDYLAIEAPAAVPTADVLVLDEILAKLAAIRPQAAALANLRIFAGLTTDEAAAALQVSPRTARRLWTYARAWLRRELDHPSEPTAE